MVRKRKRKRDLNFYKIRNLYKDKVYRKIFIDENDLELLGKTEKLPYEDINLYIYKHSSESWDSYYRKKTSYSTTKVIDNPPFGKINYCSYDWGWSSLTYKKILNDTVHMPN